MHSQILRKLPPLVASIGDDGLDIGERNLQSAEQSITSFAIGDIRQCSAIAALWREA